MSSADPARRGRRDRANRASLRKMASALRPTSKTRALPSRMLPPARTTAAFCRRRCSASRSTTQGIRGTRCWRRLLRLCRQPPDGQDPRRLSWRFARLVRWETLRILAAGSTCIALGHDVDRNRPSSRQRRALRSASCSSWASPSCSTEFSLHFSTEPTASGGSLAGRGSQRWLFARFCGHSQTGYGKTTRNTIARGFCLLQGDPRPELTTPRPRR